MSGSMQMLCKLMAMSQVSRSPAAPMEWFPGMSFPCLALLSLFAVNTTLNGGKIHTLSVLELIFSLVMPNLSQEQNTHKS